MKLKGLKILIVDDEDDIREFLAIVLENEGAVVEKAENGEEAVSKVIEFKPQLILMDKMMPKLNGIEASKQIIKSNPESKIVILSAIGDEESQIEGLELEISDYWVKPIKSNLLVSKIQTILRNLSPKIESKDSIEYKHIFIDNNSFKVILNKTEVISLPRKEFLLLYLLMSKPDHVFRREEILAKIWGQDIIIGDRTIDVHIRKIREKIGDEVLKTIKGVGYKFVAF